MDISFTARLSQIMSLSSALTLASSVLDSTAAHVLAKEVEARIYNGATSKDIYEARCAEEIANLKQPSHATNLGLEDLKEDELDANAPDFGPYKSATFHKNGLFSSVFKAASHQPIDDRNDFISELVALKVTTPSMMKPPHDSEREARILENVRCGSVIPLLETLWQPGGRLALVFPFMPLDLHTLLRTSSLTNDQAKRVIRHLFSALAHLHSVHIIHRDIKPSNILLRSRDGPAYLADFGIAWSPSDSSSEPATQKITDVGTTSYRPPELLFGYTMYDTALDLWAAGCTVAEIVRPGHRSIFDAGDLGSELALIKSMFSTLGTPNEHVWPSVKNFPDWGKMRFVEYPPKPWPSILDGASSLEVEFVGRLVQYESSRRMSASQVGVPEPCLGCDPAE